MICYCKGSRSGYARDGFLHRLSFRFFFTFFDRASEPNGKAFWVGQLKSGTMTRNQVISGFIDSTEWCNVCATYGVKSGAPNAKAEFASKNAINFATRLYTTFMGRDPEASEVAYWVGEIAKGTQTKDSVMAFFGQSEEFTNICKKYGIDRGTI